jgi:hypothetical protein
MSNLLQANSQWASRPADQRFETLADMLAACQEYRDTSALATIDCKTVRAHTDGASLSLVGPAGIPIRMTHWAFGQLANKVGAPADYLRSLSPQMAADNLNHGLARTDGKMRALIGRGASNTCRALTGEHYSRIWNTDIIQRLMPLAEMGWRVPPARPAMEGQPGTRPATAADVLTRNAIPGLSIRIGDPIAPAGLYASDHDMFGFMVNESRVIDDGSEGGLARGFFVTNSEVGAASLKVTSFLYRSVCGNHIVWGASAVKELRIVHRGKADERFSSQLVAELRTYADHSASEDEARIVAAKRFELGTTKDEVLDRLFGLKILGRKALDSAYEYAINESDAHAAGSPRTAWGMAQGITRLSQEQTFADKRAEIDKAAGRVLEMAF